MRELKRRSAHHLLQVRVGAAVTEVVTVEDEEADLALSFEVVPASDDDDAPDEADDRHDRLVLVVDNLGPARAEEVVLVFSVVTADTGVRAGGAQGCDVRGDDTSRCELGGIDAGFQKRIPVALGGGQLAVTAQVTALTDDPDADNNALDTEVNLTTGSCACVGVPRDVPLTAIGVLAFGALALARPRRRARSIDAR